jgi:hypothetical protein
MKFTSQIATPHLFILCAFSNKKRTGENCVGFKFESGSWIRGLAGLVWRKCCENFSKSSAGQFLTFKVTLDRKNDSRPGSNLFMKNLEHKRTGLVRILNFVCVVVIYGTLTFCTSLKQTCNRPFYFFLSSIFSGARFRFFCKVRSRKKFIRI